MGLVEMAGWLARMGPISVVSCNVILSFQQFLSSNMCDSFGSRRLPVLRVSAVDQF